MLPLNRPYREFRIHSPRSFRNLPPLRQGANAQKTLRNRPIVRLFGPAGRTDRTRQTTVPAEHRLMRLCNSSSSAEGAPYGGQAPWPASRLAPRAISPAAWPSGRPPLSRYGRCFSFLREDKPRNCAAIQLTPPDRSGRRPAHDIRQSAPRPERTDNLVIPPPRCASIP